MAQSVERLPTLQVTEQQQHPRQQMEEPAGVWIEGVKLTRAPLFQALFRKQSSRGANSAQKCGLAMEILGTGEKMRAQYYAPGGDSISHPVEQCAGIEQDRYGRNSERDRLHIPHRAIEELREFVFIN